MSSLQIYSSAPNYHLTGIKDMSTRVVPPEAEAQPIHLPLFWGFASQGDDVARVYTGNTIRNMYGDEFLDYSSKYVTHTTPFIDGITSEGNMVMFQRLIPGLQPDGTTKPNDPSAAQKAWIRFSLGITPQEMTDPIPGAKEGEPKERPNGIQGYSLRWTTTVLNPDEVSTASGIDETTAKSIKASLSFGQGLSVNALGLLTEDANTLSSGISIVGGKQERIYPIFDLEVSHFGEYGNNIGLRLSAPNTATRSPMDMTFFRQTMVRPFRVEFIKRKNKRATATTISNMYGEATTDFVLKPNTVNPLYNNDMYMGTMLLDTYRNLDTTGGRIPTYGPFNNIKVYHQNIDHILRTLFAAEKKADEKFEKDSATRLTKAMDQGLEKDEHWQLDIFTGLNIDGLPYRAIKIATVLDALGTQRGTKSVSMQADSEHWASKGSDGDVSIANYHRMVKEKLESFKDSNNTFLDIARYPFSFFYDTGYPVEIKEAMGNLISARKDVAITLSTHSVDESAEFSIMEGVRPMGVGEEVSAVGRISGVTRTRAESDIHGTGCVRASLILQAGNIIGSRYRGLVPLTYEIAMKRAKFMGAANGVMRSGYGYDQDGIKQLRYMNHVTNAFVPQTTREINWTGGASWAQFYDRNTMFFPAVRTLYKDDTSVLLSDINMIICVDLQKVCFRNWRRIVGDAKLTEAEYVEKSDRIILEDVDGRYDGRVVIKPRTHFTPADQLRGYSWSCDINAYFNNMRTVGVYTVIAYRQSDLEGGN